MNADQALLVMTTVPDAASGERLQRALVEERLVACAQRLEGSLRSVYHWDGELHDEAEQLLLLKTLGRCWPALQERIPALHPYDTPELLALPAQAGDAYLAWMRAHCATEEA